MNEEVSNQLKLITKRIDKLAKESQTKMGFNTQTSRLKLLAELVREQAETQEIIPFIENEII